MQKGKKEECDGGKGKKSGKGGGGVTPEQTPPPANTAALRQHCNVDTELCLPRRKSDTAKETRVRYSSERTLNLTKVSKRVEGGGAGEGG